MERLEKSFLKTPKKDTLKKVKHQAPTHISSNHSKSSQPGEKTAEKGAISQVPLSVSQKKKFTAQMQKMVEARATADRETKSVVAISTKEGSNYGRIFRMTVDENDDMIKGTFKWLGIELEDLEQVEGRHDEKGPYTEYFTPGGERVLGTREYREESEEEVDLC